MQTYQNTEIIIINDASTDHSDAIIASFKEKHKNIKGITNIQNQGISKARNQGLEIAQGDYIYFMDSDDWILKNTLKEAITLTKEYQTSIVEFAYTTSFGPYTKKLENTNLKFSKKTIKKRQNY